MTDDIVAALRDDSSVFVDNSLLIEAADEIERLRAFGYQWLTIAQALYYDHVCADSQPVLGGDAMYVAGRKQWDGKYPWISIQEKTDD